MSRLFVLMFATTLLLFAQQSEIQEQQVAFFLSPTEDSVAQQVREARNKIFHGGFSIFGLGPPPMTAVTLKPMSEMPLDQSDTVVAGEVTRAQPFLTFDRRGLYTECTIKVLEKIKAAFPIASESIALLCRGGQGRLEEGRVVRWIVDGDGGLPIVGRQYLLFLSYRSEADAYLLRKMWIVQEGRIKAVFPDDLVRVSRGESVYDGSYVVAVLASLRADVAH